MPKNKILWKSDAEDHDYPAAQDYLLLILDKSEVYDLVSELTLTKIQYFKAKDIFRASGLSLLGVSNSHVKKNLKKIKEGKELSPILLVCDARHARLIIADGYHRMCSIYSVNEDAEVPCKIVYR